jgi:hypothetical protein
MAAWGERAGMYYNNAIACCYESKHCHKMMGQICNAKEIGKNKE